MLCNTDFSIGHGGENDVKRHTELKKHADSVKASASSKKKTNFLSSGNSSVIDGKVMKAELLFFGFICEHNLPIATADHVEKLFKAMFPDSKIAKKYSCSQTKATHILSRAVAKESIFDLKSTLSSSDLYTWFGLATGGSSDENDAFLPILIRHFATNGLVTTSLIDMPDIDKGSDSDTKFETCTSSLRKESLFWETCCTYSSDNTGSMVSKNKSLLKLIKDA